MHHNPPAFKSSNVSASQISPSGRVLTNPSELYEIHFPSGDRNRQSFRLGSSVASSAISPPSAGIMKIFQLPLRPAKTRFCPSGDQQGCAVNLGPSRPKLPRSAICRASPPAVETAQMPPRDKNVSSLPSGDQAYLRQGIFYLLCLCLFRLPPIVPK